MDVITSTYSYLASNCQFAHLKQQCSQNRFSNFDPSGKKNRISFTGPNSCICSNFAVCCHPLNTSIVSEINMYMYCKGDKLKFTRWVHFCYDVGIVNSEL